MGAVGYLSHVTLPVQPRNQVGGEEPTPSFPCLLSPQRDAVEATQPHPGV